MQDLLSKARSVKCMYYVILGQPLTMWHNVHENCHTETCKHHQPDSPTTIGHFRGCIYGRLGIGKHVYETRHPFGVKSGYLRSIESIDSLIRQSILTSMQLHSGIVMQKGLERPPTVRRDI